MPSFARLLSIASASSLAVMAAVAAAAPAAAEGPAPRISLRGSLDLADACRDAEGHELKLTGLSGVTWLGDDRYAAIMDNSDTVVMFRLELSPRGEPRGVTDVRGLRLGERHDYEDISPCPESLTRRIVERQRQRGEPEPGRCALVCEEDTPAIRAISLDDGRLLGVVPIPEVLKSRRPNRGLEPLAIDPDGRHAWTANEEALADDGPEASPESGTVVRLVKIAIPGDGSRPHPAQFAYAVDRPHAFVRIFDGPTLSGVTALVSLGGGRLLVLERSGGPGLPLFSNRITMVDTTRAEDVATIERGLADHPDAFVAKRLVWQDALGCNLEGLCLGPPLEDGGRALIGIADNGGLGLPNRLVAFAIEGLTSP